MNPTLLLALGGLAIFVAIVLALTVIGVATTERRGVARSLSAIQALDAAPDVLRQELEKPFSERVLAPLGERLVGIGRRLTRADAAERLRYRLNIAGNPPGWDVNRIIGLKVLGLGALGAIGLLLSAGNGATLPMVVLVTAGFALFGYVLPNILLYNAGLKREESIRKALPDALDLLTISVEAGLGFDAAVGRVARETSGPLALEFARVLQEMQIGSGRLDAIRAMGERTTIQELKGFATAMVQADAFGVPVGQVLRVQSRELRVKRRQRAEEKAQQVPVKILFPMVLFILPCLFIVVIGPGAITALQNFGGR